MSYYTGKGDDGTTGLLGKGRVPKNDARIEALGTLDEASAALGAARAAARDGRCAPLLLQAQRDLYALMAEVAAWPDNAPQFHFDLKRVEWLEQAIDELGSSTPAPREFIVPGDTPSGAALSVARAVVRRAERRLVDVLGVSPQANPALQQYINRLSSLLFLLELVENHAAGKDTTTAKKE